MHLRYHHPQRVEPNMEIFNRFFGCTLRVREERRRTCGFVGDGGAIAAGIKELILFAYCAERDSTVRRVHFIHCVQENRCERCNNRRNTASQECEICRGRQESENGTHYRECYQNAKRTKGGLSLRCHRLRVKVS